MRVSRKGDRDPDKWLTVPAQRKAIERWIEEHGHQLVDVREDIDVSGRLGDRPNLEELVTQVERGELDGIVVAKVDRFSRDLAYGAVVARRIERVGGLFVAADDGVVLGPNGRDFGGNETAHFLFAQLLSMADFFGRRVARGWHETIDRHVNERGRHWGSSVPFGFVKGEDGRLEVDPQTAALVVEAFERRTRGDGASTIARWLNDRGARTARAGIPTHRWVKDLLANRVYLGEARAGARVHEGAHPALVDEALFAAAQLAVRPSRRARAVVADDAPALSGLVRCWHCRTVMTGAFTTGRQRVYRCRRFHSGGVCPGPASALERELLELVEPVFWHTLGEDARAREVGPDGGDRAELVAERDRALRARDVYRDAEDIADMEPRIFAAGLRARQELVASTQAALDDWDRTHARPRPNVAKLRKQWSKLPPASRGYLLGEVIGAIVVRRPETVKRGQSVPLRGRAAALLIDDLPVDLPRQGGRASELVAFAPFDDKSVPWVLLGE